MQRIMGFPYWIRFLEEQTFWHQKGFPFNSESLANNVSHIGCRYAQHSVLCVLDQITAFDRCCDISCILLLNLVVLTLRRNAPGMEICDFPPRIEMDIYRAMLPSFGPQNLVSLAYVRPDFIHRQNTHIQIGRAS